MLFNSFTFLLFFPAVLALYSLPLSWRSRKLILLLASYVFYMAWNPPFVLLLWISTLVDWFCARGIHAARFPSRRRGFLVLSLATNLGLLAYFKYGGFILENFVAVASRLGIAYEPAPAGIVLPVGISFYTFQTLSYTVDVYRGDRRPWHSILDYALYVTFFPQLVAGPIVRSHEFLPQCVEPRRASRAQLGWGVSLLLLGLFEKVVVADEWLAPVVERVYDVTASPGAVDAWVATLAFSGQLFSDFAGYSTCAIGIALCLGFRLPTNFRFPYAAVGFADFWRRWHITLSSWLRDYLYIPLGGSRRGEARTYANIVFVMLLCGLWHGAAWTFIAWGLAQGVLLAGERGIRRVAPARARPGDRAPVRFALALGTYLCLSFTFALFRAVSFERAGQVIGGMLGLSTGAGRMLDGTQLGLAIGVMTAMFGCHWLMRDRTLEAVAARTPWWLRAAVLAAMLMLMFTVSGEERAFIYFRF